MKKNNKLVVLLAFMLVLLSGCGKQVLSSVEPTKVTKDVAQTTTVDVPEDVQDQEAPDSFDYNDVALKEVSSSYLYALGYGSGNLVAKFRNTGDIYVYYDVPKETYTELLNAESIGSYFNSNIKGVYEYERVEESSYVKPDYTESTAQAATFVVNTNTRKFHKLDCKYARDMTDNMHYTSDSRSTLIDNNYEPCKICNP